MRWAWALLVLLLTVAPAAAEVTANLDVRGSAVFQGYADGEVGWTGSVRDSRLGHVPFQGSLDVVGAAALLNYTFGQFDAPQNSPTGVVRQLVPLTRQEGPLGEAIGRIDFRAAGPNASLRLIPDNVESARLDGSFVLNASRSTHEELFYDGDAQPYEEGAQFYPPFGGLLDNPDFTVPAQVVGRVVVTDYEVTLAGRPVDLRWQTRTQGLPGLGYAAVVETHVLVVSGTFSLNPNPGPSWQHSLQWIRTDLDGDLLLSNAQGKGSVNGTNFPDGAHLFQAIGEMTASADYSQATSSWAIGGTPQFVAVNAQSVFGNRQTDTLVASGLGLLLLGALAKWWRYLAAFLPGLNVAKPLGNPQRTRLLAAVAESPGIDQNQLSEVAGLARGTVRHHLRILLRADLLTERPLLGRKTYTLNDSSYEFPVGSLQETTAAEALAILQNPFRRAIGDALTNLGDAESEAIRRHLSDRGIHLTRDLAWYHLRLMEDAGIVVARREGRRVTWSIQMSVPEVKAQQRKRFLAIGRLERLLDSVPEQPTQLASIKEALSRTEGRGAAHDIAARLDLLVATGFVVKGPSGYRKAHVN